MNNGQKRYAGPQNGAVPQNGQSGQNGYQNYGYPPQGGIPPQGGVPQQGNVPPQGGIPQQGGYPPQGWAQPQYGQARQSYPPQQGYAPQNPQGYASQGQIPQGQVPQGYGQNVPPQGYSQNNPYGGQGAPYGRMQGYPGPSGYNNMQQPMPYPPNNPYGQVNTPQQYPAQKKGLEPEKIAMIVLCLLPVLFVVGLVSSVAVVKWIFIVLAAALVAVMWVRPIVSPNSRFTFTAIYAALVVVALISVLTAAPVDATNNNSASGSGGDPMLSGAAGQLETAEPDSVPLVAVQETEVPLDADPAVAVVKSFFYFWSVNGTDDMVSLCAPSWQTSVEEPNKALFTILTTRIPVDYTVEQIGGTANDASRTVTVTATIDKQNGRAASKYRFSVLMVRENDTWYVDPRSLTSNEALETATPEDTSVTPTPDPSAAAATVNPDTVLYYNPDGGSLYHADQNCQKVGQKYRPLKGTFKYSQLNDSPFSSLTACNVCNAPLRAQ